MKTKHTITTLQKNILYTILPVKSFSIKLQQNSKSRLKYELECDL